ncbi:MAG TPA: cellulase family glycosylhydrolase [Tepidisphaeraceae bacterium]|nr:cellulase family glycosylhydrolase [Tepidisphaeraceae bacterium]
MRSKHNDTSPKARAPGIDPLEPRRLFAAIYGEIEPNQRASDAIYVALDASGAARLDGRTRRDGDKDYFAFAAAQSGTIELRVETGGKASALLVRIERPSGEAITTTRTTDSFAAVAGQTYYFAVIADRPIAATYSLLLQSDRPPDAVSQDRIDTLSRGVNVPHWFWDLRGIEPAANFRSYFTDTDAANLRSLGLTHIRIPIQPTFFFDFANPTKLRKIHLDALHDAINIALRNDLGVIVAPIGRLQNAGIDPSMLQKATTFYRLLSADLRGFDPERVFIQLPGEPAGTPDQWQPAQEQLAAAVRSAAPEHTILATTPLKFGYGENDWGTVDALRQLRPVADRNVVYGLHYYEPYFFTHQGASWALAGYEYLHDVPYPSTPESAELAAQQIAIETAGTGFEYLAEYVRYFGQARWDANIITARLQTAFDWAAQWNVPLVVDEFGVYAFAGANVASRDAWIRDVRLAAEQAGAGWTMWDFADDFGLLIGQPEGRWLRFSTAAALGLLE